MTAKPYSGNKISIQLVALLVTVFLIPIMYIIIYVIDPAYAFLGLILVGVALILLLSWGITSIVRRRKYSKTTGVRIIPDESVSIYDETSDTITTTIKDKLTFAKEKELRKRIERCIQNFSHNEDCSRKTCSLSKTIFSITAIGIYCPECNALFKKKYLVNWFLRSPTCPICRKKIIVLST